VKNNHIIKDKEKKNTIVILFILIYCLAYLHFFRPLGVGEILLKAIYYVILFVSLVYSMRSIFSKKLFVFSRVLKVLTFFMFLSIIPAQIFWNQNFTDTFISTLPFLTFLFYFYLVRTKPSLLDIEYVTWIFVIIYLVCFYIALIMAPVKIFEGFGELDKGLDTARGLSRIRLTIIGGGPLYINF
jgi:hypothetical protein